MQKPENPADPPATFRSPWRRRVAGEPSGPRKQMRHFLSFVLGSSDLSKSPF